MTTKSLIITKASGENVPFSYQKLRTSLQRSGADDETINTVIKEVEAQLYEGITTKKIYQMAFGILKKSSRPVASRYKLKQAIMELGPSGYPFEKFIGEILRYMGYQVEVGQTVKGHCVNHEIDVIAEREEHHFMIECKYHNHTGTISDVKIPLYIQARFKDVEAAWLEMSGHSKKFHQGWVVTNTRFSSDAVQYGICAGLYLMGWNYPATNGLKDQIDNLGLYPLTCLTSLSKNEKQIFLNKNIVLCKEICDKPELLKMLTITEKRAQVILEESYSLCKNLISNDKH